MRLFRTTVAAAAFAAFAATLPRAVADGEEVLAYGRNVDGICTFDPPVETTHRFAVRTDAACRLLAVPDVEGLTLNTPATHLPKRSTSGASPTSGVGGVDLPDVAMDDVGDLVGTATDLVHKQATGYRTYRVTARWTFWNEQGQMMYHDDIALTYRQSVRDGTFSAGTFVGGSCSTGVGYFPHRPRVESCTWSPGFMSGHTFSFVSEGTYADSLLLAHYDRRRIGMGFVAYSDGEIRRDCTPLSTLPLNWSHSGCRIVPPEPVA